MALNRSVPRCPLAAQSSLGVPTRLRVTGGINDRSLRARALILLEGAVFFAMELSGKFLLGLGMKREAER